MRSAHAVFHIHERSETEMAPGVARPPPFHLEIGSSCPIGRVSELDAVGTVVVPLLKLNGGVGFAGGSKEDRCNNQHNPSPHDPSTLLGLLLFRCCRSRSQPECLARNRSRTVRPRSVSSCVSTRPSSAFYGADARIPLSHKSQLCLCRRNSQPKDRVSAEPTTVGGRNPMSLPWMPTSLGLLASRPLTAEPPRHKGLHSVGT